MADRYAKRGDCVVCRDILFKRWYETNAARVAKKAQQWHAENIESARPQQIARAACLRARKRNALPDWADIKAMRDFYERCPPGMEVDHVVPFNGKNVCGLHVLENLQYLTVSENRRKCNRHEA